MTSKDISTFTTNPEYIELAKFLIEKAENITPPINVWKLCREFKSQSRVSQSIECLKERVHRFSSIVQGFQAIDKNTKVKLLFGLSVPLYSGFLKELQKHADVTLDSSRRIIDYKEKGGTLQLNGQHGDPICMNQREKDMIDHLAKIAKITNSPLSGSLLVKKFKEATGSSESIDFLRSRYKILKNEIFELADFDIETKIRMLFVSGAELHDYVLEELRCDAHVEVDQLNRITKYEAKNGSLILEGDQNRPDRVEAGDNESMKTPSRSHLSDSDVDHEDSDETIENKNLTTRSGRISKVTDFFKNQELKNRPSTSEKRKEINRPTGSNTNTPKIDKKRKILASMAGSSSSNGNAEETESINETVEDDDISIDYTQPIEFHKRVKLEPFEGVLIDRTIDRDDDDIQLYFPDQTEPLLIPKQECHSPYQVKFDRPNYLLFSSPTVNKANEVHAIELKNSRIPSKGDDGNTSSSQQPLSSSNEKEEYTTQTKALEVIHNLIFGLNIPKLSDLQKKIEVNIEKVGTGDGFNISFNEIRMAIETCVYRVTKNATASPNEESTSLKEFLLVLRSVLFPFRFTLISSVQEKLVNTMEEIRDQDKRIPVEKVQSALQTALDIMDL